MSKKNKSLMQSEVFVIIMIIVVMLYAITTIYAIKLEQQNKKLELKVQELESRILDPNYIEKLLNKIKKLEKEVKLLKTKIRSLQKKIKKLENENKKLKDKIKKLELKIIDLQKEIGKLTDELNNNKKPPLITLSEDEKGFKFDSGKAAITDTYKSALKTKTLPELINNIKEYKCNTIEIYGFTDTQPFNKNENIDDELYQCIAKECKIDKINIHSNLELGMKRAISIVNYLKQQQKNGLIDKDIVIKPYSAGQFIDEKGRISSNKKSNNKKRRRIEIRLSRDKRISESQDIP